MEIILYNQEAEKAILGTVILNNSFLLKIADILEPEHFYFIENKTIYQYLVDVGNNNIPNEVTLRTFFQNNDILKNTGGLKYLSSLLECATNFDIRNYAKNVFELFKKRQSIELIDNYTQQIKDGDFNKFTSELVNNLTSLLIKNNLKHSLNSSELLSELQKDEEEKRGDKFISTGFKELDKMLDGGIYQKQMMVIAARPSVGKTTIAQQIILNAAKNNHRCFLLSLEVDRKNILLKFLSNLSHVPFWKYRKKCLNESDLNFWNEAKGTFSSLNISVNDSSNQNIIQIENLVKNQLEREPFDLLVIDYAQIIKGVDIRNKNEAQIIKENTTALKSIARTYDIALIVLAQINRKGVEGATQEPTMNDLKGSGGFEEDADSLIIIHRSKLQDKKDGYLSNSGKLILAKQRYGRTGEVEIFFDGEISRITESNNF